MTHPRLIIVKMLQLLRLNRLAHVLYYRYIHGFNSAGCGELLPTLDAMLKQAKMLGTTAEGDYFEFGIFKGHTLLKAQEYAAEQGIEGMHFFGFDSFRGLPEPEGPDVTKRKDFYRGQYACAKERVVKNLTDAGIQWNSTFLIDGFFDQSLTDETKERLAMRHVAVALIDCDLYASTRDVLSFLADLLTDQSILMFDDWNCFDKDDGRGQRLAFSEFLRGHSQWRAEYVRSYGLYGRIFLMRRAGDTSV